MAQINKPTDYFNTVLYSGSASSQAITGVGFQPDLIIVKNRTITGNHYTNDIIRGASQKISTNSTSAEFTQDGISSFDSDGFTVGTASTDTNNSGNNYVAWNWLASNTTASNTDGSITSTVSANTTSGFSIVSYTGTGANATIGHGLGAVPKMIIIKNRTDVVDWSVNHQLLNASLGDYTRYLTLNSNSPVSGAGNVQYQNTAFTSSVFNVGTNNTTNGSGDNMIAYCFAEKKGFSKFGLYTGNGSADGTFVYTGFKPAFIMLKNASSTGTNWFMHDSARNPSNPIGYFLTADSSSADQTTELLDITSNGFKQRNNFPNLNGSGDTYIYMAFAENPLVGTNNTPATAR